MICIRTFGKFSAQAGGQTLDGLHAGKPLELFCYLLLHRDRHLPRETVASVLWGDFTTVQSRKQLRQVLWQLQTLFHGETEKELLQVDRDAIRFSTAAEVWLDVALFEGIYAQLQCVPSVDLSAAQAYQLKEAVDLYRGELLEGWYQDWCLFERERLQNAYLIMLEKLMCYCERHAEYEAGLDYGERSLRLDRAHERAHRAMMRLHYLNGNRAAALRQYMRCEAALREELNVRPSAQTLTLLAQIRADQDQELPPTHLKEATPVLQGLATSGAKLAEILGRLAQFSKMLAEMQAQIQRDVQSVEYSLPQCAEKSIPPKPSGHYKVS